MGGLNLGQEIAVAVATVIAGVLSLFGSLCIIVLIVRKRKYKQDTYSRILLGTSIFDFINAIGWIMAPFAPPQASSERALSIGTVASCTMQGFLVQVGIGFMMYNACLSIYYVLTIRYNLSKAHMAKTEILMHSISIAWGIGAAIAPIPMELYNELGVGTGCWIGRFPQYCETELNPLPCVRGGHIDPSVVGYVIAGIPSIICLIIVIVCNTMVYLAVRKREVSNGRFTVGSRTNNRMHERTKAIASQATWYVLIFVQTVLWQVLLRVLDGADIITSENESSFTPLILLGHFFSGLSGFLFLLVYVRPRYLRCRKKKCSPMMAMAVAVSFRKAPVTPKEGRPSSNVSSDVSMSSGSDINQSEL